MWPDLEAVRPIFGVAAQVHYGQDDDFVLRGAVQDREGDITQETPSDIAMQYQAGLKMGRNSGNGVLGLLEEPVAKPPRLRIIVPRRGGHLGLGGTEKTRGPYSSDPKASPKTSSAGHAAMRPALYSR